MLDSLCLHNTVLVVVTVDVVSVIKSLLTNILLHKIDSLLMVLNFDGGSVQLLIDVSLVYQQLLEILTIFLEKASFTHHENNSKPFVGI